LSTILYITFDGALQPLGHSQVVRVITRLADQGARYALVSLERASDLANTARANHLRSTLARSGIEWFPSPYREGGTPRAIAENIAGALAAATRAVRRHDVRLVHARALHSAIVAQGLKGAFGIPYLFDARAYWVDEQLEEGRRFSSPAALASARFVEGMAFRQAAGIVTLTGLQADDLINGRMGPWHDKPMAVIPTCADYDAFVPRHNLRRPPPSALLHTLATTPGPIMAIVGSLSRSYLGDATANLVARVMAKQPEARLVVISGQAAVYEQLLGRAGVGKDAVILTSASHDEMPHWLPFLDWGLLLLRANAAKRASMPTKLAEFFAAGVRPLALPCNDEMGSWVDRSGAGINIANASEGELDRAAEEVAHAPSATCQALDHARSITRPHFSLESGIAKYRTLLDALT
jgi:glycosyltransferase involved in cell wall biosynthesis